MRVHTYIAVHNHHDNDRKNGRLLGVAKFSSIVLKVYRLHRTSLNDTKPNTGRQETVDCAGHFATIIGFYLSCYGPTDLAQSLVPSSLATPVGYLYDNFSVSGSAVWRGLAC